MTHSLNAIDSLGIANWLEYENTRHGCTERPDNSLATHTEFPEIYRPGSSSYLVRVYAVDRAACRIFQSFFPDPILQREYFSSKKVQFPVHPVTWQNKSTPHIEEITKQAFQEMRVHPTSSTRTVFVLNKALPPHCLKTHTDLCITRWRRHMEFRKVAHAIATTKVLEHCSVFDEYPKIGYFPESLGAIYGEGSPKDWGFILREMTSKPHLNQPYEMIPLNALYTSSLVDPNSKPLLVDMIENSTKSPKDFLLQELIIPLLTGWAKIYLETGILLEPHGQNVLVEVDANTKNILRFSHRDLNCEINQDILTAKGYDLEHFNMLDAFTTKGDSWAPQGSHLSIVFDNSMKVVLEGLAAVGANYFAVSTETLKQKCSTFLLATFPDLIKEHFPRNGKTYNYQREGNSLVVVEKTTTFSPWRDSFSQ